MELDSTVSPITIYFLYIPNSLVTKMVWRLQILYNYSYNAHQASL